MVESPPPLSGAKLISAWPETGTRYGPSSVTCSLAWSAALSVVGKPEIVADGGEGRAMLIRKRSRDEFLAESITRTVNANEPAAAGVPAIRPVAASIFSPSGSPLPDQ